MRSNIWHIADVHLMLILFSPPIFLRENSSLPLLTHKKNETAMLLEALRREFPAFLPSVNIFSKGGEKMHLIGEI